MSRKKKTRSLKGKLNVKTGSKKALIGAGEKGKIPTHNRLAKHKKRQKSAYQKHLEDNGLVDSTAGTAKGPAARAPEPETAKQPEDTGDLQTEPGFDELSGEELLKRFEQEH